MRRNKRTPLSGKPKEDVTVIVNAEWGYQYWLWEPDMTPQALVTWWRSQEEIPEPPGLAQRLLGLPRFPGWIHRIYPLDSQNRKWERGFALGEDPTRFMIGSGGWEGKGWVEFTAPEDAWYLHVNTHVDSFLLEPGWIDHDYTRYFHRGHTGEGE